MSVRKRMGLALAALLGVAAYTAPPDGAPSLDDPSVERTREAYGGNLGAYTQTRTRWYHADLQSAQAACDNGQLRIAAQLAKAYGGDGPLIGILSTRTNGLIRLPRKIKGRAAMVRDLEGRGVTRSVFDEMFPAAELAALLRDGVNLGVGVAELVPVAGRIHPVMVRLEPEWLEYRWNENRWYYNSVAGPIPITPGDGRWILHLPGGRIAPWNYGLWRALGKSWINKSHAEAHHANWEAKLANPARVAVSPQGASEAQKQSWFQRVMAWGVNTVFGLTPGYDVKLLESNGRGHESFTATIDRSEREYAICVNGQVVTVDGGTGFSNQDIHKSVKADIIQGDADALAGTLNTQGLPPYVVARWGEDALAELPLVEWDVTTPGDLASQASTVVQLATGITAMTQALAPYGRTLDVDAMCSRFAVPLVGDVVTEDGAVEVELELEPEDGETMEDDAANDNAIDVEFDDEEAA